MALPAPKVLLMGESGSGKTHSIRTLVDAGITPFCIFTEPGMEVLGDIKCPDLHWNYIPPARQSWATMIDGAKKVNTLPMEAIAKLPDMDKTKHRQFISLLENIANFTCERCGEAFGDATEWGTDRAFVLDSLSGVNVMAMDHVVGSKPVKSMQNWGVAMDAIERLINKLCSDTYCWLVITAHVEREVDEVTGGTQTMASTLGRKLAPKLPRFFSDVIQTHRAGSDFSWRTSTVGVATKARNLPWATDLSPTFATLLTTWQTHGGQLPSGRQPTAATPPASKPSGPGSPSHPGAPVEKVSTAQPS